MNNRHWIFIAGPIFLRVDRRSIEKEATALYAAWPNKLFTMFFSSVIIFCCKMCIYNAYNVLHCVYLNIPSYKRFVMKKLQKILNHLPTSIKFNSKITISIIIGSSILDINFFLIFIILLTITSQELKYLKTFSIKIKFGYITPRSCHKLIYASYIGKRD